MRHSKTIELVPMMAAAFIRNGPLTREQMIAMVGACIPPEAAFRACTARNRDNMPMDEAVASGRRSVMRSIIWSWIKAGVVIEDADGRLYPSPESRHRHPDAFVDELQGTPLHDLGMWIADAMTTTSDGQRTGMRMVLRQMLTMAGRAVESPNK